MVVTSVDRPNLKFSVEHIPGMKERERWLLSFLKARSGQSGIVYARTRRGVEDIAAALEAAGIPAAAYHAGMPRDVRARVREVSSREYVDPEGGTVAYAVLFIPNESVFAYIQEHAPELFEAALRDRVVCCSPLTLFAVLAIVPQTADCFRLQEASDEVLSLLGRFETKWRKFNQGLDALGKRIDRARAAYDQLAGPRRRMLERPLGRIDEIRARRGLPVAPEPTEQPEPATR